MTESVQQLINYLGDYCERAGEPGLFAEPLNAATNLFFILAAVVTGRMLRRLPRSGEDRHIDCWLLVAALFSIGVGSGIWHMAPTAATVLMDVIPITVFIHIYLIVTLRRILRLSKTYVVFWWLVYCGASVAAQMLFSPHLLHGTILYIPTYVTLMLLTVAVYRKDPIVGRVFARMLGLWTVSLICRTVDLEVCPSFPLGTHFLWHTLNAWMLYRLLCVYVRPSKAAVS